MIHSLSAQVSHYSEYIQHHPGWAYVGVYADEAITGTKDARDEFQRKLEDCREGKIDLILTKAISRFAQNTVTLLATVRELKLLGVDVYFEKERMKTCKIPYISWLLAHPLFTLSLVCLLYWLNHAQ